MPARHELLNRVLELSADELLRREHRAFSSRLWSRIIAVEEGPYPSAEASRRATERALYAISNTETISDFASLRERLKRLQIAIRGESYEMAHYKAQSLREGFLQLRSRRGFDSETSQIALQALVTFLRKVQDHLEKKLQDQTYDLPVLRISASLSDHATEISGWIEQKRFTLGEEKDV
jgi:hypothetical protein